MADEWGPADEGQPTTSQSGDDGRQSVITADTLAFDTNTVFRLLSNERRRQILLYLCDTPQAVPLDDLVATLTARETTSPSEEQHAHIRIDLVHAQLPRLADVGALRYEQENETIVLLDAGNELAHYLDTRL